MDKENLHIIWKQLCDRFKESKGEPVFNNWIKPLELACFENGVLCLKAPNNFIKSWVNTNYKSHINLLLNQVNKNICTIEIQTEEKIIEPQKPLENVNKFETSKNEIENKQIEFSSNIDAKLNFENFVVSQSNKVAYNVALNLVENNFNPLVITGGVGRGKTHLLNAIANKYRGENYGKKIVCLSSEKFMFLFVKSLRQNSIIDFKDFVRSTDLFLVDDIQFLIGKQNITEEFLHSFDAIIQAGGKVVVTCDRNPSLYEKLDERLKNRLSSGITVEISNPDEELKFEFFKQKSISKNLQLDDILIKYLSDRISGNVRDLEGVFNKIVAQSFILNQKIDAHFLQNFFSKNLYLSHKKSLSLDIIKNKVSEVFDVTSNDLNSNKKTRNISRPRQVAMYLSKKLTQKSYTEIADNFGGKDHSTVINAFKTIEKLIAKNSEFHKIVSDVEKSLS